MYEIGLTIVARLRIMALLNAKMEKARSKASRQAADLYDKVELPEEERDRKYMIKRGDNLTPNNEAIRDAPVDRFLLDHNDLHILEDTLENAEIAPSEHRLWYDWVWDQVQEAKKIPLDDEETKARRLANIGKNAQKGIPSS